MRWAWLTLVAFVLSVLAGITSLAAPTAPDDGDDDDDELDDAALLALPSPTRVPVPLGALIAAPLGAPLPRLAVDELFRPPRFSSV
jgi:hypothetical protein